MKDLFVYTDENDACPANDGSYACSCASGYSGNPCSGKSSLLFLVICSGVYWVGEFFAVILFHDSQFLSIIFETSM